jgi:hypothetical protein
MHVSAARLEGGDQGRAQRGAGKLDPTQGVVKDKAERGTGFIAWTEDDLAKYRERWPLGTWQRLGRGSHGQPRSASLGRLPDRT